MPFLDGYLNFNVINILEKYEKMIDETDRAVILKLFPYLVISQFAPEMSSTTVFLKAVI